MDENKAIKMAGLKVTYPRIQVLSVLQSPNNQHVSAEQVHRELIDRGEEIGLGTVYHVLSQFSDVGIVERHHFDGGKALYELSRQGHHDHLVCLQTGKVLEFQDKIINERLQEIAAEHKMAVEHYSLFVYGMPTKQN